MRLYLLFLLALLPALATCMDTAPLEPTDDLVYDLPGPDGSDGPDGDDLTDAAPDLPESGFEVIGGTVGGGGGVTLSSRFRLVSRITPIPGTAASETYTLIGGVAR